MKASARASRGARAEAIAAVFLERAGYEVLARNVRVGRLEVDILARSGEVVVLVEVRARGPGAWVGALSSVGVAKQDRLRAAARAIWRAKFALEPSVSRLRFDLIAVRFDARDEAVVEHVPAAFVL